MEYASVIQKSGNVWNKYRTMEEARAFIQEVLTERHVDMCVAMRWVKGDQHGPWVQLPD
jgi:hypothetical protein